MIDILYVLGAVASISSAIFSAIKAGKAKKYAERAKSQIENQRRISELSELVSLWDATYPELAGFGPGSKATNLRGMNAAEPARKAQDYIEEVRRRGTSLRNPSGFEGQLRMADLALTEFSDARSGLDLKDKGTSLLKKLNDLNGTIKSTLYATKEKVDLS